MANAHNNDAFVRTEMAPTLPPPRSQVGVIGWMRASLFSSWWNTILTLVGLYIIWLVVPGLIQWAFVDAVWTGSDREACLASAVGHEVGACWAFVRAKIGQFVYGRYPDAEIWRVNVAYFVGIAGLIPLLIPSVPFKAANVIFMLGIYPVLTLILLTGGHFDIGAGGWVTLAVFLAIALALVLFFSRWAGIIDPKAGLTAWGVGSGALVALVAALSVDWGLAPVPTSLWGGLLVTLVVAVTGIVASLPIGILLALGRRSKMPVVRLFSIMFIEFWRGVPLITVLFMASVMLPLFLPEGVTFDKLLRCLIGVTLFAAAYMAEVVRGGLQAIPRGQYEGAQAMGLSYWKMMGLVVLPQALKLVIPGIVNTFIGLFKDTTLVLIIGLFDLLGIIQLNFTDANWSTPTTGHTGYAFAAAVFWIFCFGMSRYSIFMEHRLSAGERR
ncbi:amino acid ABC transporter permease [Kaustia mangrovi]|uniref:Amino acid ABC transporter permease n=1 Tax=Kaustia mangrovi TaxID=2593653 RepID=A0A7S8C1P0_9HYPH|nr:amino acid ABC transporter permease [Kaustia mangrovi]QPC41726.1 amino acid ABC transporter permease [Kaustia mangrovi]